MTYPNQILFGDNLEVMPSLDAGIAALIYIDPSFNTGNRQQQRLHTVQDQEAGDHIGFQGKCYKNTDLGSSGWSGTFDDYLDFLLLRIEESHRLLGTNGSFFLHLDYREVHYCKVALDRLFGRECFMNEIIWAYDYGEHSTNRWSAKHDNILWYVRNPSDYTFNFEAMERIPYMAPGLVGPTKALQGKTPTDVWWHTIVSPNAKQQADYATQKPLGVLERIIKVHSNRDDLVIDFFAGSGTTGEAAAKHGRRFLLIDNNPEAIHIMATRLGQYQPSFVHCNNIISAIPCLK